MEFAITVGLVVILIWVLGLLVLARNSKLKINKIFMIFAFLLGIWTIANFIDNNYTNSGLSLVAIKTDFFLGPLLAYAFWYFTKVFLSQITVKEQKNTFSNILLVVCLSTSFLSLTNLFYSAHLTNNKLSASYSDRYTLYSIILGLVTTLGVVNLIIAYKRAKGIYRAQAAMILMGFLVTVAFITAANLLIPLITASKTINVASGNIAYLGEVFFIGATAYAIIKHKLFDVRLIVARSIAYLTSLIVLASIYGFLVFGASNLIFHLHFPVGVQIFIAAATAVASLSFAKIKLFFDRITNKLFFRDSYDTQVFFDEFNQTLVATYELDELLKESIKIIEENIKPAHCQFVINKTPNTEGRIMGTANKPALDEEDLQAVKEAVNRTRRKLIVADELEAGHESLQKRLRAKDIVLTAALTSSSSGSKTDVGYLLLGPKKSGNLYSSQDQKVIEIVANELVIAVQNALRFEEIESFNITLQGKVEEATKKLRRANEKLKELDETKDDFISMASHQLRTPLTSVKGYISMVLEGDAGKIAPKQREMLGQAFFSSQRMVYLIADLLNVSRLKTGKFVIDATPVNLAEMVHEELSQLEETVASHSLTLTYDKPKNFPVLMLDETKTRQVIMNFVDNAIYYTLSKGHIDVQLTDNKSTVELRVKDDGIGVPKSEQPHMFTKFYRAGNARKARPDGTGLGLFMAKKVVIAQGGSVVFESQEGKGSSFGFTFSKTKLAVKPKIPAPTGESPKAVAKT